MLFISSVRHLTIFREQASKERKAFDERSRIILSNRHTFCYVHCVLVFIWTGRKIKRTEFLPQLCPCNSFQQLTELGQPLLRITGWPWGILISPAASLPLLWSGLENTAPHYWWQQTAFGDGQSEWHCSLLHFSSFAPSNPSAKVFCRLLPLCLSPPHLPVFFIFVYFSSTPTCFSLGFGRNLSRFFLSKLLKLPFYYVLLTAHWWHPFRVSCVWHAYSKRKQGLTSYIWREVPISSQSYFLELTEWIPGTASYFHWNSFLTGEAIHATPNS